MEWFEAVFGRQHEMTAAQECARAVLVLTYGLVVLRAAGRRIFGKWSALDIIVSIIVGSNLSRAMTGGAPLLGTLAATTLLIALHWVLARLAAVSPAFGRIVEGGAITLAVDGRFARRAMLVQGISDNDLAQALRTHGLTSADETARITLEPGGSLSVIKKE